MVASESTTARSEMPRVVIEPRKGWLPVNWQELWQHRELLYFLTWRDIKVRYKQTVLGVLWAILQPLMTMVVLTVIFKSLLGVDRRLMGSDGDGYPYAVFLFAGLLPWQFFAGALKRSSDSVVMSAPLTQKVYFPRLIIPMASVGAVLVDFALSLLVLVGLMLYYGIAPGLPILAIVPLALGMVVAALGVGA
ncbi:MAG: ABC transporter permease, partial [Candidatus Brocadiae bacterium]|nr:ABC transporter permease [Candidatus Brocadiia bacterium]